MDKPKCKLVGQNGNVFVVLNDGKLLKCCGSLFELIEPGVYKCPKCQKEYERLSEKAGKCLQCGGSHEWENPINYRRKPCPVCNPSGKLRPLHEL